MIAMPGIRCRVALLVLCIFLRTAFAIMESDFYEYRGPDSQVLPSGNDNIVSIDLDQPFSLLGNLYSNLLVSSQCVLKAARDVVG